MLSINLSYFFNHLWARQNRSVDILCIQTFFTSSRSPRQLVFAPGDHWDTSSPVRDCSPLSWGNRMGATQLNLKRRWSLSVVPVLYQPQSLPLHGAQHGTGHTISSQWKPGASAISPSSVTIWLPLLPHWFCLLFPFLPTLRWKSLFFPPSDIPVCSLVPVTSSNFEYLIKIFSHRPSHLLSSLSCPPSFSEFPPFPSFILLPNKCVLRIYFTTLSLPEKLSRWYIYYLIQNKIYGQSERQCKEIKCWIALEFLEKVNLK